MSDKERPFELRDQMAMAILQGIMAANKTFDWYTRYHRHNKDEDPSDYVFEQMVRMSYRLADVARKIRLSPFK